MHQALFSHNSVWKWQTVLQVAHPPQYFIFIMFREFCLNVYAFQFGPSSISFCVTVPLFPLGAYSSIMPFSARALMLKEVNWLGYILRLVIWWLEKPKSSDHYPLSYLVRSSYACGAHSVQSSRLWKSRWTGKDKLCLPRTWMYCSALIVANISATADLNGSAESHPLLKRSQVTLQMQIDFTKTLPLRVSSSPVKQLSHKLGLNNPPETLDGSIQYPEC